jgi:hypothetical protein
VTRCHVTLLSLGPCISGPRAGPQTDQLESSLRNRPRRSPGARRSIANLEDMPPVPGVTVDEARLADVCARYGIARLSVFGSVARGTATPDSDIDVLYELEPSRRLGWEIEQLADRTRRRLRPARRPGLPRRAPSAAQGCSPVRGADPLCGVSSSCSRR